MNIYGETVNRYFSNVELKRLFFEDINKFKELFNNKNSSEESYNLYMDTINSIKKWEHVYSILKIPMPRGLYDRITTNDFNVQHSVINYNKCGVRSKMITGIIKMPSVKYVSETECIIYKIDDIKENRYFLLEVEGFIDENDKSLKKYKLYEFINEEQKKLIDSFVSIKQALTYVNELY